MHKAIIAALVMITPPLYVSAQPHLTISRSDVQTGNGIETGNFVLDFHDGSQHTIPYISEETSYLTGRIQSPGTHWLPMLDMSIRFSGPAVGNPGSGGGGGGGDGPPTVINGMGTHRASLPDGSVTGAPILAWAARGCVMGIGASLGIANFTCRNSGGIASFSYSLCSFGTASIQCQTPPPPPEDSGGNGGSGGGGGGGGGGAIGSAGMGTGFSTQTVNGEIIVHPLSED